MLIFIHYNKKMQIKKIISLLVLMCTLNVCYTEEVEDNSDPKQDEIKQFKEWKIKRGRKYKDSTEESFRTKIFVKKARKIKKHNAQSDKSFEMGVNDFTQMTDKQFEQGYLNTAMADDIRFGKVPTPNGNRLLQIASFANIDHRSLGKVSPVKNQGGCGSCWAFAAVGTLEHLSLKRTNTAVDLSEQQLVDFTYTYNGCNGGWPATALNYVKTNSISLEITYPYTKNYAARDASKLKKEFSITSVKYSNTGCSGLTAAVQTTALAVALYVDGSPFYSYKSGYYGCTKVSGVNHAVLLVGVKNAQIDPVTKIQNPAHWIIKNSWGTSWGEAGFMKISMAKSSTQISDCNICKYQGSYAL